MTLNSNRKGTPYLTSASNYSGFTLIETMIAVGILATGLLLLVSSMSGSFARIKKAQINFEASALLERKVTEIELEYRGKSLDEIPEEKGESFGEDYPQYEWKLTSKKLEFPDLTSSLVGQDDGANTQMLGFAKQLTEGISKAIKEVTVTVIYKNKPRDLEFSVTSYFIDYDKEFSFGLTGGL